MGPAPDRASRGASLVWVLAAALVGFAASFIFSSVLHWPRGWFVAAYSTTVALFAAAYLYRESIAPGSQLSRRWKGGAVVGLLAGLLLARSVASQPGSDRPLGSALVAASLWYGVAYGLADAVLLSILPVLIVYGSRAPAELSSAAGRLRWGALALLGSLFVTAAYHLGFAEFRGPQLVQPIIGNAIVTVAYLLSGNPLAAMVSHIIMHSAAVMHGMESTAQLPPHY